MENRICDNFLILALNPRSGNYMIYGNQLTYGLLGALLMDLMTDGYLAVDNGRIVPGETKGIPSSAVLDKILSRITGNTKSLQVTAWIRKLGIRSGRYLNEVRAEMIANGLVRVVRKKILFIPWSLWYPADPGYRKKLIFRIQDILLTGKEAGKDEAMLLGLIYATKLHKALSVNRDKRKRLRKALVIYMKKSDVASGTDKIIREIQTTIAAGVVASISASNAAIH
ncbi:MAG: GPP34 family phosphoprotein [Bacteroidales bacterium]|nr:GPP34 family phosphoprotein [Bacteroidales bacterium]